MKKFTAILLVLLMVLSTMSFTAYAENSSNTALEFFEPTVTGATGEALITEEDVDFTDVDTITSAKDYYDTVAGEGGVSTYDMDKETATNPSSVDNSANKYFPPVGNQGSIGSCGTWAGIYYQLSYMQNRALDRTATRANSMSPMWTYNLVNYGQDTGTVYTEVFASAKEIGAPTITKSPVTNNYLSWTTTQEAWSEAQKYRISGYNYVYSNDTNAATPVTSPTDSDLDALKTALANGEIITYSTGVSYWKYTAIKENSSVPENSKYKGQSIVPYASKYSGGHRMTIVGYNDDLWVDINENGTVETGEKGAFKVVNSWGSSYQNGGFIWVSYDVLNRVSSVNTTALSGKRYAGCLLNGISRVNVVPTSEISNIELQCKMNASIRDLINVRISAEKNGSTVSSYSAPFNSSYAYATGTSNKLSFDGTTNASDLYYSVDLSKVLPGVSSENFADYNWYVDFTDTKSDSSALKVSDIKVVDNNTGKEYNSDISDTGSLNNASKRAYIEDQGSTYYTVKFLDYDGAVIKTERVKEGGSATAPASPTRTGYTFTGWDKAYTNILADTNVTAQYTKNQTNTITMYYSNSSYTTPYIHYQVGNGSWTAVPGVKMNASTEQSGYTYKYTVDLGTATSFTCCFNDNGNNWDSKNGANYTVNGISGDVFYGVKNGTLTKLESTIKPVSVKSFTASASAVATFQQFIITAEAENGTAPYTYQFGTIDATGKVENIGSASATNTKTFAITTAGTYKLFVTVTDSKGTTATKYIENFVVGGVVTPISIKSFTTSDSDNKIVLGESVTLTAQAENGSSPYNYRFTSTYSGTSTTIKDYSSANTAVFTPSKAGTYTIMCEAKDLNYNTASSKITLIVEDKPAGNTITMYYSNSSYTTPYMHYQIGNGSWTAVPGVKMNATTEQSGYTHKYTVDLGTETSLTCCFNDNGNNWDSKNGANYTVSGISGDVAYGVKNGTLTKLENNNALKVTMSLNKSEFTVTDTFVRLLSAVENAQGTVSYQFTYSKGGATTIVTDWTTTYCGAEFSLPAEEGTYTITTNVKDSNGNTATVSQAVKVIDNTTNKLTVYYNGYNTPYMHYKVGNGEWTAVPGIIMQTTTERTGYTHKLTIDMGKETSVTACFNDGNGNWDSKNGANYTFGVGTYTFSNGTITKIS